MTNDSLFWYCRWENWDTQRYYVCWVEVDLLGDLLCTLSYGGINSSRGHIKKTAVSSEAEAKRVIKHLISVRRRHGYQTSFYWTMWHDFEIG